MGGSDDDVVDAFVGGSPVEEEVRFGPYGVEGAEVLRCHLLPLRGVHEQPHALAAVPQRSVRGQRLARGRIYRLLGGGGVPGEQVPVHEVHHDELEEQTPPVDPLPLLLLLLPIITGGRLASALHRSCLSGVGSRAPSRDVFVLR